MRSQLKLVRPELPVRPEDINQERLDRLADLLELEARLSRLETQATSIGELLAIQTGYLARQQVPAQITDTGGLITIPAAACQSQGLVFDGLRGVLHPPFVAESVQEAWVLRDAHGNRMLSPDIVVTSSLAGNNPAAPLLAEPYYARIPFLSSPLDPVRLTWTVQAGTAWQGFQINLLEVDTFPVCAVELLSVAVGEGGDHTPVPGWSGRMSFAGYVRLSFPPRPVSGLELTLEQQAAVPVAGEDQYVLGLSRVRAGLVSLPDELVGANVTFDLPAGVKEITSVQPVFLFADALPGQGLPGFSYTLTDPSDVTLSGLPVITDAAHLTLTFYLSPAAFAGALPQLATIVVNYRLL